VAKRRLISIFVGVPDDMLLDIGRIIVLAAQLDHDRMQLLEAVHPVTESAARRSGDITQDIKEAFSAQPFDRLLGRVLTWLQDVGNLLAVRDQLAHSVGGYEVRADGTTRYTRLHLKESEEAQVQFGASRLKDWVMQMADASDDGNRLVIESSLLKERGAAAHDDLLKGREEFRLSAKRLQEHDPYDEETNETSTTRLPRHESNHRR
jgi:hypothetical protein